MEIKSFFDFVDIKYIVQADAKSTLKYGQLVYLDVDGLYKPSIATSDLSASFEGIVWGFSGTNGFFIKVGEGEMRYRLPLPKSYYLIENGRINEEKGNPVYLPGNINDIVYISETEPGGIQTVIPSTFNKKVGNRSKYGFIIKYS